MKLFCFCVVVVINEMVNKGYPRNFEISKFRICRTSKCKEIDFIDFSITSPSTVSSLLSIDPPLVQPTEVAKSSYGASINLSSGDFLPY